MGADTGDATTATRVLYTVPTGKTVIVTDINACQAVDGGGAGTASFTLTLAGAAPMQNFQLFAAAGPEHWEGQIVLAAGDTIKVGWHTTDSGQSPDLHISGLILSV